MAKTFHIQIVTPGKVFYEGDVVSLVAPGEGGYLGVLADHAPLISNLKPGKIKVTVRPDDPPLLFDSPGKGFLEVFKNQVTLLVRSLEPRTASADSSLSSNPLK